MPASMLDFLVISVLGKSTNVVHRDLYLYFHGHTHSGIHIIYNIWKTVRAKNTQVRLLLMLILAPSNDAITFSIE